MDRWSSVWRKVFIGACIALLQDHENEISQNSFNPLGNEILEYDYIYPSFFLSLMCMQTKQPRSFSLQSTLELFHSSLPESFSALSSSPSCIFSSSSVNNGYHKCLNHSLKRYSTDHSSIQLVVLVGSSRIDDSINCFVWKLYFNKFMDLAKQLKIEKWLRLLKDAMLTNSPLLETSWQALWCWQWKP